MSNVQDDIKHIVAQLKQLQIQESDLLLRLERLTEANSQASEPLVTTRAFAIGDLVQIKNPRPLQAKKGKIVRIGVDTDRITVEAKNGSKIIRASANLSLIK
jgi:hypothetical protein